MGTPGGSIREAAMITEYVGDEPAISGCLPRKMKARLSDDSNNR
jgi:hypothetical protein